MVILTCVMQVKGQHKVQEDVRQLLRWVRRKPVLHHAQEKLNKVSIQVFCKQGSVRIMSESNKTLSLQ